MLSCVGAVAYSGLLMGLSIVVMLRLYNMLTEGAQYVDSSTCESVVIESLVYLVTCYFHVYAGVSLLCIVGSKLEHFFCFFLILPRDDLHH